MLLTREIKRIIRSNYFIFSLMIVVIWATFLSLLISNNIKFGISIFGDLTAFKDGKSILYHGLNYTRGIGLIGAIAISIAIGKEYQYKTWQHLTSNNITRSQMYIAKMVLSIIMAVSLFFANEITAFSILKATGFIEISIKEFILLLFNGVLIYSVIASIICLISSSIKNGTFSLIWSIAFILLEGSIVKVLLSVLGKLNLLRLSNYIAKFSLYGMNEIVQSGSNHFVTYLIGGFLLWLSLTLFIGKYIFKRIEL